MVRTPLPGWSALGCLLSHPSILKRQLYSGKHLHIVEDDTLLHRDVGRAFEAFVTHDADLETINEGLRRRKTPPPDLHREIYLNLVKTLIDPAHVAF
jgi:hypothetical protein